MSVNKPVPSLRHLPKLFGTIRGLALTFAIGTALVTMLLGKVTLYLVHEELERQLDDQIDVETRALEEFERERGFDALLAVIGERDRDGIGYVTGIDPDVSKSIGYIVTDALGRRRAGALRAAMPKPGYTEHIRFTRHDGSAGVAQGMNSPLAGGGHLLVAVDRAAIKKMDRLLFRIFAGAFAIILATGMAANLWLGRIFRKRLLAFEKLAVHVTAGRIDKRMPLDGSGVEFDRLSHILNDMLDRMSALVANLRDMSLALAHDLRTPLSRIRSQIELAEAANENIAQRAHLANALGDMDGLMDLFSGLLAISEIDGQIMRNRFVPVDLANAVTEISEAHRPAIEDAGGSLALDVSAVAVFGDKALLQRLVGNLLDNTVVHAPDGAAVTVSVDDDRGWARIRVGDDGPGVPVKDHAHIFEPLVRLDASRSKPGHGLGLRIVSAIAAAHGGDVAVLPSERGLVVECRLPLLDRLTASHN